MITLMQSSSLRNESEIDEERLLLYSNWVETPLSTNICSHGCPIAIVAAVPQYLNSNSNEFQPDYLECCLICESGVEPNSPDYSTLEV